MDLKKYITTSEYFTYISQAESLGPSNAVLSAVNIRRDELRKKNENSPKECPEDLTEDYRYIAGMISMANWILGLPERSREDIKKLEKRRT